MIKLFQKLIHFTPFPLPPSPSPFPNTHNIHDLLRQSQATPPHPTVPHLNHHQFFFFSLSLLPSLPPLPFLLSF